jgi:hypothetical protein
LTFDKVNPDSFEHAHSLFLTAGGQALLTRSNEGVKLEIKPTIRKRASKAVEDQFRGEEDKASAVVRVWALTFCLHNHRSDFSRWAQFTDDGVRMHRALVRAAAVAPLDEDEFNPSKLLAYAKIENEKISTHPR